MVGARGTTVLELKAYVVEDNATIRENLIGALEELTCVRVIGNSATEDEGLQWLEQNSQQWDMVIVDLFLQRGSGIRLVQRVHRRNSTEIDFLVDYCARQCSQVTQEAG